MKDRKRDVLKRILNGSIEAEIAEQELVSAAKGIAQVTVWIQDPIAKVWRNMQTHEVQTYERHELELLNKKATVITIGGRRDGLQQT